MKQKNTATTSQKQDFITLANNILDQHKLKKTALRRSIIYTFMENKSKSLTQANLIDHLSDMITAFDRASIYRNLAHLKDAGILHEVEANNYVFCSHDCSSHAHLLLYCQKCNKHSEVKDHNKISNFMTALDGFKFYGKKKPIFLKGVCKPCTAKM